MELRNLKQILKEKNLSLDELARRTGIQKSILDLICLGAYQADGHYRSLIADAIGEYDHELFESGSPDFMSPMR